MSKRLPGCAYQCSAMPSKFPQQFLRKPPVQSSSVRTRASRFPDVLGAHLTSQIQSSSIRPEAISVIDGSTARIAFGEFVVLENEILQIGAAKLPGAPGLVADVPELDVVRLRMAVLRALAPIAC